MQSDTLRAAIRHDLENLVNDLAMWLWLERGGTVPGNRELAAEYLIKLMEANGQPTTVTARLMYGVRAYADAKKGV